MTNFLPQHPYCLRMNHLLLPDEALQENMCVVRVLFSDRFKLLQLGLHNCFAAWIRRHAIVLSIEALLDFQEQARVSRRYRLLKHAHKGMSGMLGIREDRVEKCTIEILLSPEFLSKGVLLSNRILILILTRSTSH